MGGAASTPSYSNKGLIMPLNRTQTGTIALLDSLDLPEQEAALCFGSFVLYPRQHLLFKDGKPVQLGSRALQLLVILAARSGELVEKQELLSLVWPRVIVEECNLRAQMTTLRRLLGDDGNFSYIVTVPGRGYRFVAPITVRDTVPNVVALKIEPEPVEVHPAMIGREGVLHELVQALEDARLVCVTGGAGIGKTRLLHAAVQTLDRSIYGPSHYVDFSTLEASTDVQVATALGLTQTTRAAVLDALSDAPCLLVLDSCEQALEDVILLVQALQRQAPACRVLLTSREPLHVEGEYQLELPPLGVHPEAAQHSAADALSSPAVQLLVERAQTQQRGFQLVDADVPAAVAIARTLEGNPLALEIAACHVHAFGLPYLAELLEGGFCLQMTGRRTAQHRQRSLELALDASHDLLSAEERSVLRQLSIFPASFTLAAAAAVVELQDGADGEDGNLAWLLERLLSKSLVQAPCQTPVKRYRLPHPVRLYALRKRKQLQQSASVAHRHALHALQEQQHSQQQLEQLDTATWLALYAPSFDCVRGALDWCLGADGDAELGAALALAVVPLALRLSRLDECHSWIDRALESSAITPQQRMSLLTLAATLMTLSHGAGPRIRDAWEQVIELAQSLGDHDHQLRGLWGLWTDRWFCNQPRQALALAERYMALSQSTHSLQQHLIGRRMCATPLLHLGDLESAQQAIEEALSVAPAPRSHIIDTHFDQVVAARSFKAWVQLLRGQVGQTLVAVEANVAAAETLPHPASLWYALSLSALPISLLTGQTQRAKVFLAQLQQSLGDQDLPLWQVFARCFEYILLIRDGATERGVSGLGQVLDQLRPFGDTPLYGLVRCEYAQGLAQLGLTSLALDVLDQTLALDASREVQWLRPELLRAKAQLLGASKVAGHGELAQSLLNEALELATRSGARFWVGRILATSPQAPAVAPRGEPRRTATLRELRRPGSDDSLRHSHS